MKKVLFILAILIQFSTYLKAQNSDVEEVDFLSQFVEYTVQVPFMAKVAGVQGVVVVEVTAENASSFRFSIKQSLHPDCDQEALRVCKLIHKNYLVKKLNGATRALIEVPFKIRERVEFVNNKAVELFDNKKKPHRGEEEPSFARTYEVDTLTGCIRGNVAYWDIKTKTVSLLEVPKLEVDSSQRHTPEFLEKESDTLRVINYTSYSNRGFPVMNSSYYSNGQIKMVHLSSNLAVEYFPSGRVAEVVRTEVTEKKRIFTWFANGLIASVRINYRDSENKFKEKCLAVWDTLGNQVVVAGTGKGIYYESRTSNEGAFLDGLKDGKWIGRTLKGKLVYEETYANGVLQEGESYSDNQTYHYTAVEQMAEFDGGVSAFGKFLSKTLSYPREAQKSRIGGKVYVQFVVCTDGTLCDYKVLKSVGGGCDEEAVRALQKSSGSWKPGVQRGRPVRSRFTIPINFNVYSE